LIPLRTLSSESSSAGKDTYGNGTLKENNKKEAKITKSSNKNTKNVFGLEDTMVVVDDFNYISS